MLLTAAEAKEKYCPLTLKAEDKFNHIKNVYTTEITAGNCLASQCMVWQWATTGGEKGYCGLAER